ncbi:MAG: hypothetical protein HFJ40_05655 [Clostridia bacterium]|nr:hypothetical protein [Clostridia bacterium]
MDIELKNGEKVKVMITKNDDMYEYYIKGVKIGVYDPNKMYDNVLMIQNTLENELSSEIKDGIDAIDKAKIQEEAVENNKILEYCDERDLEHIRDIYVIDLSKEDKNVNKSKMEEQKDKKSKQKNKEGTDTKVEKTTTKDINIKQEISLSERANDMHDFKKWLGGKIPEEFTKVAIIESSQMGNMKDENGNSYKNASTRYSLALVDKDNNVEPLQKYIPNLRQRDAAGNNPTEQKYQVDKNGNVEKDAVLSEYEIGSKIIQIDNKEMGRVELNIGQEEHGGNETMGVQMRDSNSTYTTSRETRSVIGEYESNGQYTVDENLEEAKQHTDCDKMTSKDIDGDPSTKSHNHIDEIIEKILENDEISSTYNYEDIKNKVEQALEEDNEELTEKEFIEKLEKDIENNAEQEHELPSKY